MTNQSGGNCIACHSLSGTGGVGSNFGPSLDHVAARLSTELLRQWVTDARVIKPDTLMPPFGTTQGTRQASRVAPLLTEEQISQVVATLRTLR